MALIQVHKIMIGAGVLFSALFSAWSFNFGQPSVGAVFAVITVALGVYLAWFVAKNSKAEE